MFSRILTQKYISACSGGNGSEQIALLREKLKEADAVIIGAGSGLSTSAGFTYDGPRFNEHFADFVQKYGIRDMYSGGFYPFEDLEEHWAWWSRQIYWNRYVDAPGTAYHDLLRLVQNKDYFVLTTNVDHQFQRAGFDKKRLFYTQGDYGLWQCTEGCQSKTYDNETQVRQMLAQQKSMKIPSELVPRCPLCGKPMTMNLRCDDSFVEDEGWYAAKSRYEIFLQQHKGLKMLLLELGVGGNTPVIIKYPFWRMAKENPHVTYACINAGKAYAPAELKQQALCIEGDIGSFLCSILC